MVRNTEFEVTSSLATVESGTISVDGCKHIYIKDLKFTDGKYNEGFSRREKLKSVLQVEEASASLKVIDGIHYIIAKAPGKSYIFYFFTCGLTISEDSKLIAAPRGPHSMAKMDGRKASVHGAHSVVIEDPVSLGALIIGDGGKQAVQGFSLYLPSIQATGYSEIVVDLRSDNSGSFFSLDTAFEYGEVSIDKIFDCKLTIATTDHDTSLESFSK